MNAILFYAASQEGKHTASEAEESTAPAAPPTNPPNPGCSRPTMGYDCMSLAQYAVYQGTGRKVELPADGTEPSGTERRSGRSSLPKVRIQDYDVGLKPGDVDFWGGTISDYHHSAIYAGIAAVRSRLQGSAGGLGRPRQQHSRCQEHTMGNLIERGTPTRVRTGTPQERCPC